MNWGRESGKESISVGKWVQWGSIRNANFVFPSVRSN